MKRAIERILAYNDETHQLYRAGLWPRRPLGENEQSVSLEKTRASFMSEAQDLVGLQFFGLSCAQCRNKMVEGEA